MGYVDFGFYKENYCGTVVPEDEFSHYELKASAKINYFINTELEKCDVTDEIKFAVCEVCDILYEGELHSGIEYERNDGYWVSYEENMTTEERIRSCVKTWLFSSGLLYRGRINEN